jgi:hypothetical protein
MAVFTYIYVTSSTVFNVSSRVVEVQIFRVPDFERAPRLERARNERSAERDNEPEENIGKYLDGGTR